MEPVDVIVQTIEKWYPPSQTQVDADALAIEIVKALDLPALIDDEEAAHHLNTTTRHLRRLVTVHGLPHVNLGGKRRFLRSDLDRFVERSRITLPAKKENPS